jgi:hypothetical protein
VKIEVTLPLVKETTGALKYAVADISSVPVGSIYVRKTGVQKVGGQWPSAVKITVEVAE